MILNIDHEKIKHSMDQVYRVPDDISSEFKDYYLKINTKYNLSPGIEFSIGANVEKASVVIYCKLGDI